MNNRKTLMALVLALGLVISQISAASAAPLSVTSTNTCDVKSATFDSGTMLWTVDCTDGSTITMTEAQAQGTTPPLVDSTNALILNPGESFTFDSGSVTNFKDNCALPSGGSNQPVGAALATFFCGGTGATYDLIQTEHMDGFGYGVIAQALFMSDVLGTSWQDILTAKQTHNFGDIKLPDGSTPKNWGQIVKAVIAGTMNNLGGVMSGRLTPTSTATSTETATGGAVNGQNNQTNHGNSGNHAGGNGKGHGHGPGGNGNGNGNPGGGGD